MTKLHVHVAENWYRDVWLLIITIVVVITLLSALANQRANTAALCALRSDVQARAQTSAEFLAKHPRGIPGIPAAAIQAGIDNEKRTVQALAPVRCSPPKHPAR